MTAQIANALTTGFTKNDLAHSQFLPSLPINTYINNCIPASYAIDPLLYCVSPFPVRYCLLLLLNSPPSCLSSSSSSCLITILCTLCQLLCRLLFLIFSWLFLSLLPFGCSAAFASASCPLSIPVSTLNIFFSCDFCPCFPFCFPSLWFGFSWLSLMSVQSLSLSYPQTATIIMSHVMSIIMSYD